MRTAQEMDGTFVAIDGAEIHQFNPDDMLKYVERYWKSYVKFNKIEKTQRGVLGSFSDGSAVYFVKPNSSYMMFCPEYKHCKNFNESELSTSKSLAPYIDRKTKFVFWSDGRPERTDVKEMTREEAIEKCKTVPTKCAALIERDGWEIKDDYPW